MDGYTHTQLALFLWRTLINTLAEGPMSIKNLQILTALFPVFQYPLAFKDWFQSRIPYILKVLTRVPEAGADHKGHLLPLGLLPEIAEM